jgi:hypothetical protein
MQSLSEAKLGGCPLSLMKNKEWSVQFAEKGEKQY